MRKLITVVSMLFCLSAHATDISLTWDRPTEREDGSQIQTIDRFNIYHTVNNTVQGVIEVPADATDFQLYEIQEGIHTFQISTVELGQEAALSDPVTVTWYEPVISPPKKITITGNNLTVEVIE